LPDFLKYLTNIFPRSGILKNLNGGAVRMLGLVNVGTGRDLSLHPTSSIQPDPAPPGSPFAALLKKFFTTYTKNPTTHTEICTGPQKTFGRFGFVKYL
jgi:hypothetical protein